MSHRMTKPTKWPVRPADPPSWCPGWSEFSLCAQVILLVLSCSSSLTVFSDPDLQNQLILHKFSLHHEALSRQRLRKPRICSSLQKVSDIDVFVTSSLFCQEQKFKPVLNVTCPKGLWAYQYTSAKRVTCTKCVSIDLWLKSAIYIYRSLSQYFLRLDNFETVWRIWQIFKLMLGIGQK